MRRILTEQGDYDYRKKHPQQKCVSIAPHNFRSDSAPAIRNTGNYADNPIIDPRRINESLDIVDEIRSFLHKEGISDDAFLSGARLTRRGYRKMARELGISESEIELLLRSLATRIEDERKHEELMLEEYRKAMEDRFSYEADHLGNMIVRDNKTSDEVRLVGTPAVALANRLRAGKDHQRILAGVMAKITEGDDDDHSAALEKTGFWGRRGAGAIVLAQDTGRILLAHRSAFVEQPFTWGGWGGAIDPNEDPKEAALREVREETGYTGEIVKTIPLYVFKKGSFRYFNFLIVVPREFKPRLNWESHDAGWFEFRKWPTPLHFGLTALFNDAKSVKLISKEIARIEERGTITEDEDSFDEEIASSTGTYNFPWRHNGRRGFATARYRGRGPEMKIDVISIRDEEGEPVDASPALMKAIKIQAVEFIGDE